MSPVVSMRNVFKRFIVVHPLNDISLDVHAGELFGLLGPNGAGKTTLLQTACYFALVLLPAAWWLPATGVTGAQLAFSALYFLLGYALFAAMLITAGMVVRGDVGPADLLDSAGDAIPMERTQSGQRAQHHQNESVTSANRLR